MKADLRVRFVVPRTFQRRCIGYAERTNVVDLREWTRQRKRLLNDAAAESAAGEESGDALLRDARRYRQAVERRRRRRHRRIAEPRFPK